MWCHKGINTLTASGNYQLELSHSDGTAGKLQFTSQSTLALAEDDEHLICVAGRLRPYDQDYLTSNSAEWFLSLYQRQTDNGAAQIWLNTLADNRHSALTAARLDSRNATISPDGRQFAFVRLENTGCQLLLQPRIRRLFVQLLLSLSELILRR